jgi:hypothetical protein
MRLGLALDRMGVEHDLPSVREHDRRGQLLEISKIATPDDVRSLAELVHQAVSDSDERALLQGSISR